MCGKTFIDLKMFEWRFDYTHIRVKLMILVIAELDVSHDYIYFSHRLTRF